MDNQDKLNQELKAEDRLIKPLTVNELHHMQQSVRHLLVSEQTEKIFNENLRKKLEPKPNEIIKTGFHFDDQLLLKALEKYDSNYNGFEGWKSFKNNLFWRQIIGFIQRYLTACTGQAFCQGLYYVVDKNKKLERTVNVVDGVPFFLFSSLSGLGIEYAGVAMGQCGDVGGQMLAGAFRNLCQAKHQYFDNLSTDAVSQSLRSSI